MIDLVQQNREAVARLCRQFRVRRLDVFGSAVSGSFDESRSDLDFLVTLEAGSHGEYADNYLGLADGLEALFHRRADLVTESAIRNPFFRQAIEQTRQPLYEA
jgi:predicted nucleotidyltransferase